MGEGEKVAVVACAGMDKALGSVARVSVFKAVEVLRPEKTELVCLPPALTGVATHAEWIKRLPVIAVDGCAERCATKLVVKNGGKVRGRVLLPVSAQKHDLLPEAASNIGPSGLKLAERVAEEIASIVDRLTKEGE
jgi:uncharacterized metal-binding protein